MTNEGLSSHFLVLLGHRLSAVMPAPVAGIHVLTVVQKEDVDGRNIGVRKHAVLSDG
jgi:hypothetical protein